MSQNSEADKLWESMYLGKFPEAPHHKVIDAKVHGSIDWLCGETTQLAEMYDKFVMMKRLRGIESDKKD